MAVSAAQKMNCLWPLIRGGKGWIRGALIPRYEAAIWGLMTTPMGHYPWNPNYGTTIYRLRTQGGPYEEDQAVLRGELSIAFKSWIPDVMLLDVKVSMNPQQQKLSILVVWGIPSAGGPSNFAVGPVKTTVLI